MSTSFALPLWRMVGYGVAMDMDITYQQPAEMTELADGTPFPRYFTCAVVPRGLAPLMQLTLEVRQGRPVLTRFTFLDRGPEGPELSASAIHETKVGDIVQNVIERVGETASLQERGVILPGEGNPEAGQRASDLARGRRGPSESQLQQTANIWRENTYDPRKQVAEMLDVSPRTASRFIALAKERGYITTEED